MCASPSFRNAIVCVCAFVIFGGTYHAGQRSFLFEAPALTAEAGVSSATVTGLVWYPASPSVPETPQTVGAPDNPLFDAGSVALDAPIAAAPRRFPLIVVSHGTGGAAFQMAWLGTVLARAGFIALAIDHPGNTTNSKTVAGFVFWWLRPRTLSAALDAILADPSFRPRIDAGRIGAAGFSIGGFSALGLAGATVDMPQFQAACAKVPATCDSPPEFQTLVPQLRTMMQSDPALRTKLTRGVFSEPDTRIRAVYAIAPAVGPAITLASLQAISVPVRIAYGRNDTAVPPKYNAEYYARAIPRASVLTIPGAAHYTFLDTCTPQGLRLLPALCTDPIGVDRAAMHRQVAVDSVRFFQLKQHLSR